MTTLTLAVGRPTLVDRVVPRRLVTDIGLVLGGALLTGALAQIAIPLWPVPITGQTLAVVLVGGALGATRGALSMLVYALVGALGVPWFSDGTAGWAILLGPTGGYIVGFVFAAAFTGWLAQRRWDRRFLRGLLAMVGGSLVVFAIGLPWLAFALQLNLQQTLEAGLYPFIIGGVIKAALAAALMPLLWRAAESRRGGKSDR